MLTFNINKHVRFLTCILYGGKNANRTFRGVFGIMTAWWFPRTQGKHVVGCFGGCDGALLRYSYWAGAWVENTLCTAKGRQTEEPFLTWQNKWNATLTHTHIHTHTTVVCPGLISLKCSATSSLLLNCVRHSGHLLPTYCTSSGLLVAALCDCCVGAEVTDPKEDNVGAEAKHVRSQRQMRLKLKKQSTQWHWFRGRSFSH